MADVKVPTIEELVLAAEPALRFEWQCPLCPKGVSEEHTLTGFSVLNKKIMALVPNQVKWSAEEHVAFAACFLSEIQAHVEEKHGQ